MLYKPVPTLMVQKINIFFNKYDVIKFTYLLEVKIDDNDDVLKEI